MARIAAPLYKCTSKNGFNWTPECQSAFDILKQKLQATPILKLPDFTRKFYLQCDASGLAIGSVLTQIYDDGEHPIAYASRRLSNAEQSYTITEKELLAIIWASERFQHYIYGQSITIVTDHKPLADIKKIKIPQG